MSTILMISLAIAIIFWRPPFQLPRPSRTVIVFIIITIMVSSLLWIGAFRSSSRNNDCNKLSKQGPAAETSLKQATF